MIFKKMEEKKALLPVECWKVSQPRQVPRQRQLVEVEGHVDVVPTKRKLKWKQTFELNQNF